MMTPEIRCAHDKLIHLPIPARIFLPLIELDGGLGQAACDPYDWPANSRMKTEVHHWLCKHFDEIESGAVVDVEFILGETSSPKLSEACS
jgi:hypothetical protein